MQPIQWPEISKVKTPSFKLTKLTSPPSALMNGLIDSNFQSLDNPYEIRVKGLNEKLMMKN